MIESLEALWGQDNVNMYLISGEGRLVEPVQGMKDVFAPGGPAQAGPGAIPLSCRNLGLGNSV